MRVGVASSEPETAPDEGRQFWRDARALGAREVRLVLYRNNPGLLDRIRATLRHRRRVRVSLVLIDGPQEPLEGFPEWAGGIAGLLPQVGRFVVWNEPNAHAFWPHGNTPEARAVRYGRLFHDTHRAIRAVRPNADVSAFGLAPHQQPRLFLRDALPATGRIPSLSVHLYPGTPADGIRGSLQLLRWIEADVPRVPVHVDEFGWNAGPACAERRQANVYRDLLRALQADPRVRTALVYRLQDGEGYTAGPVRPDGARRPAWGVIASAAAG